MWKLHVSKCEQVCEQGHKFNQFLTNTCKKENPHGKLHDRIVYENSPKVYFLQLTDVNMCYKSRKLANFSGKRVQAWLNEQVLGGRHNKAVSSLKFTWRQNWLTPLLEDQHFSCFTHVKKTLSTVFTPVSQTLSRNHISTHAALTYSRKIERAFCLTSWDLWSQNVKYPLLNHKKPSTMLQTWFLL